MNFTLRVLGTASAKPVPDRHQSAQVLSVHGRFFLIDCGEAVQRQLLRYRVPMMKIDSIFLSHIHGDHLFGLFPLLSTMGLQARTAPLNIYAPANFGPVLKFFLSYFGEGLAFEIRHVPLQMKEPEVIYHTKSVEISAFPLDHKIDTYGFLFREKEPPFNVYKPYVPRSYAYCSDTASFPELSQWVKGVTLLYHEATYPEEFAEQARQRHHSTAAQAARCALAAGAGRLLLGHFSSRIKDLSPLLAEARAIFPDTVLLSDGDLFDLPLQKP